MKDAGLKPLVLVIFGITGDLAQRKLIPALYNLVKYGDLTRSLQIVGISRQAVVVSDVYSSLKKFIPGDEVDAKVRDFLVEHTTMVQMDPTDKNDYVSLLAQLKKLEAKFDVGPVRLYYLSIPPQTLQPIIRLLGETGHNRSFSDLADTSRLLVEKPFGYDTQSAKELIRIVDRHFSEKQVYRIDHYIAKETAQNILTFRFQNPLFEAVWDSGHVLNISVKAHEKIGIEGRATFYEQTGALRDLIQSHLLQVLSLVTMEKPARMESGAIHAKKLELLKSIKPIVPDKVATMAKRGQYVGYRQEVDNLTSLVETFASVKLQIDNDRWRNVPIKLEAGKALAEKTTEVSICFTGSKKDTLERNKLIFRIQPNEGITIHLQVKRPGVDNHTQTAEMNFNYHSTFSERQADAYERVLVDAVRGDQTLFASDKEVLASWEIVENVIHEWSKNDTGLVLYEKGSKKV